jgi:hypothetical protein
MYAMHLYNTKYGPICLMHDINIIKYEPTKQKQKSADMLQNISG